MRIFIATSMLEPVREVALEIRRLLEEHFGEGSVYLAAYEHPSPERFLPPKQAYDESAREIRRADVFVLFCPLGKLFGCLVELGLALGWNKPVLALVPSRAHLPYLLQGEGTLRGLLVTPSTGAAEMWGLAGTYFRYIRAFIELPPAEDDGLTVEEARARLEERLPALDALRALDATTAELLKR